MAIKASAQFAAESFCLHLHTQDNSNLHKAVPEADYFFMKAESHDFMASFTEESTKTAGYGSNTVIPAGSCVFVREKLSCA